MRVIANPIIVRIVVGVFLSGFTCLAGLVGLRELRRRLRENDPLAMAPTAGQMPIHAFNAIIQQLKQQKHELATAQQAERRRAKTSENISAAVLSRLPSGVMFFASNGLVRQANTAARQILGFATLAGMSADEVFRDAALAPGEGLPPKLSDAIHAGLQGEVLARGLEVHYVRPGGVPRILDITVTPVFAPTGEPVGAACLINDKTEMVEIQQAHALRGEISAEMALALRNSVAAISGYARQLAAGRNPEQTQRLAEDIILEATQLDHTIGGFLAGSRTRQAAEA